MPKRLIMTEEISAKIIKMLSSKDYEMRRLGVIVLLEAVPTNQLQDWICPMTALSAESQGVVRRSTIFGILYIKDGVGVVDTNGSYFYASEEIMTALLPDRVKRIQL